MEGGEGAEGAEGAEGVEGAEGAEGPEGAEGAEGVEGRGGCAWRAPPPLTVSSPRPPVKIHSVRPSSVDRLLFVASFAKKRSDRTPSVLKRQTRTQFQNWFSGRIQENKEHAQNRR